MAADLKFSFSIDAETVQKGKRIVNDLTAKLEALGSRMKLAKTQKEIDRLTKELDDAIGFDTGDSNYDPEAIAAWEIANGRRT